MRNPDVLPANFIISPAAKAEIANLRQFWDARSLDTAAVVVIAWGIFTSHAGRHWENVVVSFYGKSELSQVAHGVQQVSGLPIVFFTTPEHHPKFEGKVVDYDEARGFFLRDPD
jgi:hypothetical protein